MSYAADLPIPGSDDVSDPHWRAARARRLEMQRCERCSGIRWPPAPLCPACLTTGGEWTKLSGSGRIWSLAVYHRAFHPSFAEVVPYVVALIELSEGPFMISNVVGADPSSVRIGQPVEALFEPIDEERALVKFIPSPEGQGQ